MSTSSDAHAGASSELTFTVAEVPAPTSGFGRMFVSLRYRDYRLLWSGTAAAAGGSWLQQVALSWIVYDLTNDAFLLGLLNGLRSLPFLLAGPVAGVAADRFDRRWLMIISQAVVMILAFALGTALIQGVIDTWHLFVYTLLSGLGWAFSMPVRQSLVPNLVPRRDLLNAIALSSAAFNVTRAIGPAAGGFLIAWIGAGSTFLAQGGLFLLMLWLIYMMRVPARTHHIDKTVTPWKSMVEGLVYVKQRPLIAGLLLLQLAPTLIVFPYMTLLPIFAKDIFEMGPQGFGLMLTLSGVGSMIATLGLAMAGDFRRKGLWMILAMGLQGPTLFLFSQSTWLFVSLLLLMVVGAAQMAYNTINQTIIQQLITDDVRGRIMSLYMLEFGLVPLGSFAAGATAKAVDAPTTIAIMGIMASAVALWAFLRLPQIRHLEHSAVEARV